MAEATQLAEISRQLVGAVAILLLGKSARLLQTHALLVESR